MADEARTIDASDEDARPISELTIGEARRVVVYTAVVLLALFLFFVLIGKVLIALLLGVVAGVYLLPVQEWLERRLRARGGSAIVTIALIVVPLALVAGYVWYELSGYSTLVTAKRNEIIAGISESLARIVPVGRDNARVGLETAFAEAITRSAGAVQGLREQGALLLSSTVLFLFTIFYVLTQRVKLSMYLKLRVPGEYLPFYEKLTANVGGALRGALRAVFIDQLIKAAVIFVLNIAFGVPLAIVLAVVTFFIGFFPLIGEWAIYIPISIYLLVFTDSPLSAGIYLTIGLALTLASSLFIRPRLASAGTQNFNFYWMLVALVSGVYAFGVPGIVLGPAIVGFVKAVADTLVGDVNFETSLLKEEIESEQEEEQAEQQQREALKAQAGD